MSNNKTKPTNIAVQSFLETISDSRREETTIIINIMHKISGDKPVMWGSSIIGFGTRHYKSEAGREGDICLLGFSPRKSALTIYFYEGFDSYGEELSKIGKYKISQGCLYINKLSDINLVILEKMLKKSYRTTKQPNANKSTVDEYINNIPDVARDKFDQLRSLVHRLLPGAHEVMSYGIIGYKPNIDKRAVVFISAWKDHLAVYPIPKNPALQERLKPYVKGKGTLWFMLDKALPRDVISEVVKELSAH